MMDHFGDLWDQSKFYILVVLDYRNQEFITKMQQFCSQLFSGNFLTVENILQNFFVDICCIHHLLFHFITTSAF